MQAVTLEELKAAHLDMGAMIARFEAEAARTVMIRADAIVLAHGEHYAGLALDKDGKPSHHLVLLPGEATGITWPLAIDWASSVGGYLPSRQEQALLYANLKSHFQPNYYWSDEQHAGGSDYAWLQYFYDGDQNGDHKSYEGRARAVRRLPI